MTRPTRPQFSFRFLAQLALKAAIIFGIGAFVIANRNTATEAIMALRQARPIPVTVGLVLSAAAIVNRGLLHRSTYHTVGLTPTTKGITRTSTVSYSANTVLRTGGVSGLAVFLRHGKHHGFPTARVITACGLGSLASMIGLGGLLAAAVLSLGVTGRLSGWWMAASAGYAIYATVVMVALLLALRSKTLLVRAVGWGHRARHRLLRRDGTVDDAAVADFSLALDEARANGVWFRRAVAHALLSKAFGIAMLVAGAAAAGIDISLIDGVIIYATALVASFASLFPAGMGTVEASLGALFVAAGAALPVAVVAIALYRIFDVWIPVLAGAGIARFEFGPAMATPPVIPPKTSSVALAA